MCGGSGGCLNERMTTVLHCETVLHPTNTIVHIDTFLDNICLIYKKKEKK